MKLVLVHGRNQQGKDAAELKKQWVAALTKGLANQGLSLPAGLEIEFPYYGNRLGDFAAQAEIPLSEEIMAKGGNQVDQDYLDFRAEVVEALRQRADLTQAQIEEEYGDDPREKGPQNWAWTQAILRALDRHVPGMSQATVDRFTRDVFLYISRMGVRDEIDRIVGAALGPGPTVVVSHSLGTVVSYSLLRRNPALQVPFFVTLGSPLGVRAIRNELRPLKYPQPPVTAWYNAYDERDFIALYPLDGVHFPVEPAIENNNSLHNDPADPHSIVGYLRDATVARRIYEALI